MSSDDVTKPEIPSRRRTTPTAAEVLRDLEEHPEGYRALFDREGSLALAAYSLAAIRIQARGYESPVPSRADLRCAARTLRLRLELRENPSGRALARECIESGRRIAGH